MYSLVVFGNIPIAPIVLMLIPFLSMTMLKPLLTTCFILTSIAASLTTFSHSAYACNAAENKLAPPISIKLDPKGFKTTPTQVKIGPNSYKLNAEIIQNQMPTIGPRSRTPNYAIVSLVPVKGSMAGVVKLDRLFVVNGNDTPMSVTCDPVERSAQKVSTTFRGLPGLPEKVDVVLQFRSKSGVHFVRARNVKVLSVY